MVTSRESASTPIHAGGYRYQHDDPQDRADLAGWTADELLAAVDRDPNLDLSDHPAWPATDYGTLTDYRTGEALRPATAAEHAQSLAAGDTGAFEDETGRTVFVAGGPES